jgi:Type VI secretion system effector, Hcp
MFPEIDGVKGGAKDKTHAKQINVLSCSWEMSNNDSAHAGGDAGPARSTCRTSGLSSTRLEEVCDPEVALELASAPKGLLSPRPAKRGQSSNPDRETRFSIEKLIAVAEYGAN